MLKLLSTGHFVRLLAHNHSNLEHHHPRKFNSFIGEVAVTSLITHTVTLDFDQFRHWSLSTWWYFNLDIGLLVIRRRLLWFYGINAGKNNSNSQNKGWFSRIYPSQRQNLLPTLEILIQNFWKFSNFQNFGKKFPNSEFFSWNFQNSRISIFNWELQ